MATSVPGKYRLLDSFEYSTEAQLARTKLEAEGIPILMMDERTIDSDPLVSQAIGGVKLKVFTKDWERAMRIYSEFRTYATDHKGRPKICPKCQSKKVLTALPDSKNIWVLLFPFFQKTKYHCQACNTIF
ncbi:MAG: DUF2007 domain-containing protein [Flavobacteriaceae bacterium]|nr:DUF2007 domain-containing protein [Flavobacteriaceae bacterium]